MRKIKFTIDKALCDRVHYVNEENVLVVLSRLPREIWKMLRVVHFRDQIRFYGGGRGAGYTYHGGPAEISLLALPPRVSLASYLTRRQSPRLFGATRNFQWPRLAVRRFLLYDVLLHELGHAQVIEKPSKGQWKKAKEAKANEFAEYWQTLLWSEKFEHPDPVHNPPTEEEILASIDEIESYKKVR